MEGLGVAASIIAVVQITQSVLGYVRDIKNASRERRRLIIEANSLVSELQCLADFCTSEDDLLPNIRKLASENGPLAQYKAALEDLAPRAMPTGAVKKVGKLFTATLEKEDIAALLAQIARVKLSIQQAFAVDNAALSSAIKEDTTAIKTSVVDQEREKLLDRICPKNYQNEFFDHIERHQAGTGAWFITDQTFIDWTKGPQRTLFCGGDPGAGKTIMASLVIQHLRAHTNTSGTPVIHIYCNYQKQEEQTAFHLVSSLLRQLLETKKEIPDSITQIYRPNSHTSLETTTDVLKKLLGEVENCFFVIDALDECTEGSRSKLLTSLLKLQQERATRLLVTSRRFISGVDSFFEKALHLDIRASDSDVEAFVKGQIHRLPLRVQRDVALQTEIADAIVKATDGMFLLATLQLDSLQSKVRLKDLRAALLNLRQSSDTYDVAYSAAMERVEAQGASRFQLAQQIFSFLVHAKRPLSAIELQIALAVEEGEAELDEDNIVDLEDILGLCAGLVTVDRQTNIVRLAHYTTQEYLLRTKKRWLPDSSNYVAQTCLLYLSFDAFKANPCQEEEEMDARLEKHPFLEYAAEFWAQHFRFTEQTTESEGRDVGLFERIFLESREATVSVAQLMPPYGSADYPLLRRWYGNRDDLCPLHSSKNAGAVHLMATGGTTKLLKNWIDRHKSNLNIYAEIDAIDYAKCTPLSRAVQAGHLDVVELLLSTGEVNVNSYDMPRFTTVLGHAAEKGNVQIVKALLNTGKVEVNGAKVSGRTPLSMATREGHLEIVKLLLDIDGVDVNAGWHKSHTPLHYAAARGHLDILALLLQSGRVDFGTEKDVASVLISLSDCTGQDAAMDAILKLLVRQGVNLNAKTATGETTLHYACAAGRENFLKLLLDNGADVESTNQVGSTPLIEAAGYGHETIVKALLQRGADIKAMNTAGQNALFDACWYEREAVTELLLNHGADIDSRDEDQATPLMKVCGKENEAIARLLIERGANIESVDDRGRSPLLYAIVYDEPLADVTADTVYAVKRRGAVIELLLAHGANINLQDEKGLSGLIIAAGNGNESIVRILLENGADAKLTDMSGHTALSYAIQEGHETIIALLKGGWASADKGQSESDSIGAC